jgi:hypothetical protein
MWRLITITPDLLLRHIAPEFLLHLINRTSTGLAVLPDRDILFVAEVKSYAY